MKFSCIMTTYNDGPIMRQSILSVLNQTFEDFQFLIVDDGSAADNKAILAEFDDPRLTVLPQANDGLSSARNRALHHARGDYVCFLDADDIRAPWAFAEVADVIDRDAPEVVMVGGVLSQQRSGLKEFLDEPQMQGYLEEIALGEVEDDLLTRKAWATAMEPQSANKYIARDLIERHALRFPNDHFFEDILFHGLSIAQAQSVTLLPGHNYTYFQRALRAQLTGSNTQTRFDILGTARVTLQLFEMHPDFANARQRGALVIGVLRLLRWCEDCIANYHRHAFRMALRDCLRAVDPLFFVLPKDTPDPRNEKPGLLAYAQEVMK